MANIPISQIDTTASNVSDGDLFLLSKKNTDGTYTSAKIDASKLGSVIVRKYTTTNPKVYISPTGSDDNLEKQFQVYGTNQQINYPLFSLTAASRLLHRIQTPQENMYRFIYCLPGTYLYHESQRITGAYMTRECAVYVKPYDDSQQVVFKRNNNQSTGNYQSFIITNCNAVFKNIKIEGPDDWNQSGIKSYGVESFSTLITFYGCEICKFNIGLQSSFSGSTVQIRSDYVTEGTLDDIETNHKPFYIHDCNYAIAGYMAKHYSLVGWCRFDINYFVFSSGFYNNYLIQAMDGHITRIDVRTHNHLNNNNKYYPIFQPGNYSKIRLQNGIPFYICNTEKQYNEDTKLKEIFNFDDNLTINLSNGSMIDIENINDIYINVDKFS